MSQKLRELTVKQLQAHIRELTYSANEKLTEINVGGAKPSKAVQTEINTLRSKGIIGKRGYAVTGFRGKTKEQLIRQARELEYFETWKGTEKTAKRTRQDLAKYRSYVNSSADRKGVTYEQWRSMVELMGTSSSLVEQFNLDSDTVRMIQESETGTDKKIDLASELEQIVKENKGESLDTEQVIDLLRQKLKG